MGRPRISGPLEGGAGPDVPPKNRHMRRRNKKVVLLKLRLKYGALPAMGPWGRPKGCAARMSALCRKEAGLVRQGRFFRIRWDPARGAGWALPGGMRCGSPPVGSNKKCKL